MKIVTVKRFCCDYCRKRTFSKPAMARHEPACIKNPERICPVCDEYGLEQVPLPLLIAAVGEKQLSGVQSLSECPCCILAALCQHRIANPAAYKHDPETGDSGWIDFNYKVAMQSFRSEREHY